jgi:preprotein translocase subunit SecD
MDETKAILDTDSISCSLLEGTILGADITVSNDSLRIDGDVIGGNYVRATATGDQPAAQASSNTTSNAPEAHATAEISFRPVLDIVPQSPLLTDPGADHPDNLDPVTGLSLPDDVNAPIAYLASDDGNTVYVVGPAFVAGDDMKGGHAQFNNAGGGTGAWFVIPEFTAEGGERFRRGTGELATYPVGTPERHLAIVVDGVVTSAPEIAAVVSPETGIDPNDVVITIGTTNDSQAEAERLAAALQQ